MLAYTYIEKGKFALVEKPKPVLIEPTDGIDGGQTEYVRVPLANQGLNRIPHSVTDEQALMRPTASLRTNWMGLLRWQWSHKNCGHT